MPKASYYYWKNHQETKTHKFDQLIKKEILVAWFHNHCIYGYPRIHKVLQNKGYSISAKKVWKLMKHLDIHSIMNKKFRKPTTTNDYAQRPNLVNGNWKHFWCADITYIQMSNHKWVYLSSVYNPNNHKVIAHNISNKMTADLVTNTMISALKNNPKPQGIHSDMGSQYTSDQFEMVLKRFKINHILLKDILMTILTLKIFIQC
jgi:putative transposase